MRATKLTPIRRVSTVRYRAAILLITAAAAALVVAHGSGAAQGVPDVRPRVQQERQPYLDTLRQLVSIESGSGDVEGLARIGELIAGRLRALGGNVEMVAAPPDMVRFENTPAQVGRAVVARFRGNGTRRILLLAHMDTVYPRGMLAGQPFRSFRGPAHPRRRRRADARPRGFRPRGGRPAR